ncbi:FAD-binding protein [Natronosporangium hydrolyticum]|uniref:FAD-binding protein n=1 Tax=Natronosporangium hydrolyticum TaxID=2811111 RepID=A0A895YAJ2_9ACTN|nr:D-arabinono-1,4-lactone oxidase [Natronosporangium hydrolyticum]QSB13315.1 FAD-binding protein [Natronosporangium hydrolyticum]
MSVSNWAGNVTFGAGRVHRPATVGELRRLVAGADRVRALGTGHSFNRIADTTGDLVSVAGLPATIEIDRERAAVTVAAGVRYGELVAELHQAGFALPSLASLPHISVAGACATGTHGSGDGIGNLATLVSALELVTADGELVELRRDVDGDRFSAAVVGLGALGVVTSLTLDLVPTFQIRQYVYEQLPHQTLADRFDEVFRAAYSVSVFTGWDGPHARQVWHKHRLPDPDDAPAAAAAPEWLGARLADGPRHPVPGASPVHCTDQLGEPGPWHLRLPHFRLDFTPSSGQELQSEYFVARQRAPEALAALERISDRIAPVLQISEVRTIAADELWLSPCYRRDSVACHFTWIADTEAVTPVVAAVEEQLAPFAARPHWGKVFGMPPATLRGRYPRLPEFAALAREFDPAGKFRNDFLDRYLPG